jgi:hypothetical protein
VLRTWRRRDHAFSIVRQPRNAVASFARDDGVGDTASTLNHRALAQRHSTVIRRTRQQPLSPRRRQTGRGDVGDQRQTAHDPGCRRTQLQADPFHLKYAFAEMNALCARYAKSGARRRACRDRGKNSDVLAGWLRATATLLPQCAQRQPIFLLGAERRHSSFALPRRAGRSHMKCAS